MPYKLKFKLLGHGLAVCRLAADASVPAWALDGDFFCVVRTDDELAIVCVEDSVPDGCRAEKGWTAFKLEGPFPFSMTGVLAAFLDPLAQAKIPIFAISTFDTDYVLIKHEDRDRAIRALEGAGHQRNIAD